MTAGIHFERKRLGGAVERGKRGVDVGASAWRRDKEERWPRVWRSVARGGQLQPPAVGVGDGAVAQQGRAVGRSRRGADAADRWDRDESRAQCQRQGARGRGVSEAPWRRGIDRRA
jgi:hypothetical protein